MMQRKTDFVRGHCEFCENITRVGLETDTGKARCCMVCQRKIANVIGGQDKLDRLQRQVDVIKEWVDNAIHKTRYSIPLLAPQAVNSRLQAEERIRVLNEVRTRLL